MVRFVILYGVPTDAEAFDKHYLEVHVPLARKMAGVRRFTLSKGVGVMEGDAPLHLITAVEWDSFDAMQAAIQSPEGVAVLADVTDNLAPICPDMRSYAFELVEF